MPSIRETRTMKRWNAPLAIGMLAAASVLWMLPATSSADDTPAAEPETAADATVPQSAGLGDPGELLELEIESGHTVDGAFKLDGQDARQQLIVTGKYATGQIRDLTATSDYSVEPEGIATVDASGFVVPLADGTATITATSAAGPAASIKATVVNHGNEALVNFPNQIVPIFTKLGCNSGGCHGKASGQNGFKLSLLGFEPPEDFEHLVKEGRGRRLFPAAPDRSLLLTKPIGKVPHGGGTRLDVDSHAYRLLRRWILQGMPYGSDEDPTVSHIEVIPAQRTMPANSQQQLVVIAHYTNGATEDVTRTATFEPNAPEMAESTVTGVVKTLDLSGDVAVMARFQGQVGVFRAMIPLGAPVESTPPENNFIDTLVFNKLKEDWGTIDFVVHSIAFADKDYLKPDMFHKTPRAVYTSAIDTSAYTLLAMAQRAMPLMERGGSILSLTYFGGEKVVPGYNVMGVAKAALEHTTRYLAYELGDKGRNIRVNTISAGPFKTLAGAGVGGMDEMIAHQEKKASLKRANTGEEVGDTAVYLVSDLSSGVTGETMHVDAGFSIVGL